MSMDVDSRSFSQSEAPNARDHYTTGVEDMYSLFRRMQCNGRNACKVVHQLILSRPCVG